MIPIAFFMIPKSYTLINVESVEQNCRILRDQTVAILQPNRDKLKLWLREIDKNVEFIGAPYKIRTCDPRFRKPMLYPTELRAQLIYSRYLSQNMSICFLNPIYISRNLSVKRQMSDTRKSGITICNSNDSFFHVKYLVAIDSESQRLAVLSRQLPASGFAGFRIPKESLSMLAQ